MGIIKKHFISLVIIMVLFAPLFLSSFLIRPVGAQDLLVQQEGMSEVKTVFGGFRAEQDIRQIAVKLILIALSFLGIIFLGLTIYAGFLYMTAGGNQEKTSESLKLLRNAIIGLLIIAVSWAITRFMIIMLNRTAKNMDVTGYPVFGY